MGVSFLRVPVLGAAEEIREPPFGIPYFERIHTSLKGRPKKTCSVRDEQLEMMRGRLFAGVPTQSSEARNLWRAIPFRPLVSLFLGLAGHATYYSAKLQK